METNKQYKNPIPVAVAIIPVLKEVNYVINGIELSIPLHLVVYTRRGIEPKLGQLALPGGFVNEMERLETGGKRELKEETGLEISEEEFQLFRSEITPNNRNLVFGITPTRTMDVLEELEKNWETNEEIREETQSFVIAGLNIHDAAFPLHQKAVSVYFDKVNGEMVNALVNDIRFKLSIDDINELVKKMKEDGYLSEQYEYKNNLTMKVKKSK